MGVNWKGLLGGIAPVLAKALTGGAPAAAAAALGMAGRALLGSDKATADEVAAAIAGATPEQLERLRAAEDEFALKMVDAAVLLEKIEAEDRAGARAMQIQTHSKTPAAITFAILFLFAAALAALIFIPVPMENKVQVDAMVEALKLLNMTAFGYWLGGSIGSRTKDTVIGKLASGR